MSGLFHHERVCVSEKLAAGAIASGSYGKQSRPYGVQQYGQAALFVRYTPGEEGSKPLLRVVSRLDSTIQNDALWYAIPIEEESIEGDIINPHHWFPEDGATAAEVAAATQKRWVLTLPGLELYNEIAVERAEINDLTGIITTAGKIGIIVRFVPSMLWMLHNLNETLRQGR